MTNYVPQQNPFHASKRTLVKLKSKLEEDERRRHKELEEFYEVKRAILRIYESDENYMPSPDIMRSDSLAIETLEKEVSVQRKVENASDALAMLKAGNATFLMDQAGPKLSDGTRKLELHFGQKPHAVLITCSDSRVPPEMIFNQGFGDLFVIRLAGNTVDALARASMLYAVQHLGVPLVVVMGHQNCGAVKAALSPPEALINEPSDMKALVAQIKDGIRAHVLDAESDEERTLCAVVSNVHHVVRGLQHHEEVAPLVINQELAIVGAYYGFNGAVTFFDEEQEPAYSAMCLPGNPNGSVMAAGPPTKPSMTVPPPPTTNGALPIPPKKPHPPVEPPSSSSHIKHSSLDNSGSSISNRLLGVQAVVVGLQSQLKTVASAVGGSSGNVSCNGPSNCSSRPHASFDSLGRTLHGSCC